MRIVCWTVSVSPSITVRPLILLDGAHEVVNEVFLDEVRVPVRNRVGEEGYGWTLSKKPKRVVTQTDAVDTGRFFGTIRAGEAI